MKLDDADQRRLGLPGADIWVVNFPVAVPFKPLPFFLTGCLLLNPQAFSLAFEGDAAVMTIISLFISEVHRDNIWSFFSKSIPLDVSFPN